MPICKDREYRNMSVLGTLSDNRRIDSDYYVEGLATTWDTPYLLYEIDGIKYYERIDRHALDGADMSDVIMQYDHNGRVLARQSNKTLVLDPSDSRGLLVCADLSKTDASRALYDDIKAGLCNAMSWAFTVSDDDYDRLTHTRTIRKIKKVYDVSAVSIPANSDTYISARAYVDGVIDMTKQELLEHRKQKIRILCNF